MFPKTREEWGTLCLWASSAFFFGAFIATVYDNYQRLGG